MKIGSLDITDIKRGSIDLEKVYRGEDLVWERILGYFKIEIVTPAASRTVTYNISLTGDTIVDWGDSSTTTYTSSDTTISHTYTSAGTYVISILSNNLKRFFNNNDDDHRLITKCLDWGNTKWNDFTAMFRVVNAPAGNLTSLPTKAPNITGGSFNRAFQRQDKAVNWSVVEDWDTSLVNNMDRVFWSCTNFNADLSGWDTRNVTNMAAMFLSCSSFNSNISGWDTSKVTNMNQMFTSCTLFNRDLSGWDTSLVTNMNQMFQNATSFNQDLSGWCVTNIPSKPENFDTNTPAWNKTNRQPIWGTCP